MIDEKHEKIADIVAEMRNWWPHDPLKYPYPEEKDNKDLCSFADRIEAAWKREKSETEADALNVGAVVATTEKSSAVGNVAEMCKALCDIVMLTMKVGYSIHGDVACGIIASKAKHAIAAPPRNCDRFGGDYKMLHTAWWDWTCSPSGTNPDGTVKLTFGEWLLKIVEAHHA